MFNSISEHQLIETVRHFVRLCDLFAYHPFARQVKKVQSLSRIPLIHLAVLYCHQCPSDQRTITRKDCLWCE